jgi:hypothetical protein
MENVNINNIGDQNCPNMGLAELLSGVTFTPEGGTIICGLCKSSDKQGECKKSQFVHGFSNAYKTTPKNAAGVLFEL